MSKYFGYLGALAIVFVASLPLSAGAQVPEPHRPAAAPARPAPARAAPAPRPAAIARPAPPRPAPAIRAARPHPSAPVARIAPRAPAAVQHARPAAPAIRNAAEPHRTPRFERAQHNAAPAAAQRVATPAAAANNAQNNATAARQERLQRQREDRALRNLPASQRAARRQDIQRAREQRAAQRQQQLQPNAQIPAQNSARAAANANRGLRRNGQARITPQAARQGRFAGAFAARAQAQNQARQDRRGHDSHFAARRAWRAGHRANFVGWYGPVFYPYAYSDIFDYAFWPDGYDDDYWYVAYDDFFDGVYYGEVGPPSEYVGDIEGASAQASQPTYKAVADLCKQPGSGITAWPTAEIQSKVGLNADQKELLGDVSAAGKKAADVFKATCPSENAFPLTPPGRLASMSTRLDATLDAVQTVRPALEKFYGSLTDEQKERFNEIGPSKAVNSEAQAALPDDAKKCGEAKPGLTNLPIEQIDDAITPTDDAQQAELDKLGEATVKAVGILQAACPSETPLTPPGRLEAIETRLKAMIEAANTVKAPLNDFYASLSAEQKARFNRLGSNLASSSTTGANQ